MPKRIPLEALVVLNNQLSSLQARDSSRRIYTAEVAKNYGVSTSSVYRALQKSTLLHCNKRSDYNNPRIHSQSGMRKYCEIIAALRLRTRNKKNHGLSILDSIRLLEEYGVKTNEGLIKAPKGLLKRSTVSRYILRWKLDQKSLSVEPTVRRFEAIQSNDCWQFDFSYSDLKKLKAKEDCDKEDNLILASVVDDRSGVCYQEYFCSDGENAMTALKFLFNAMSPKKLNNVPFQGIPKVIYTDNGPVTKSKIFLRVMSMLGTEVRTHLPKGKDKRRTTARSKGKVEREFRTVKNSHESLYQFHLPNNLEEANQWLQQFLLRYNEMPHRSGRSSRIQDWIENLPSEGFQEICTWERYCCFAREPEKRKVSSDACIQIGGIPYQLTSEMAGQEVTLLLGLFDNELYVDFENKKEGPFYPSKTVISFDQFKKWKKNTLEKQADQIKDLSEEISIPRTALSDLDDSTKQKLDLHGTNLFTVPSQPFLDEVINRQNFSDSLEAKVAIAEHLGFPLSELKETEMERVNGIVSSTLDKEATFKQVDGYFSSRNQSLK